MRRCATSVLTGLVLPLLLVSTAHAAPDPIQPDPLPETAQAWYDTGFDDVGADHVFADDITWLAYTGISRGYDVGHGYEFRPQQPVLREQMAAFLYRYASASSAAPADPRFTDLGASHVFYAEVEWLASTGISTGYPAPGGPQFRGSDAVLREQMAAFLWRYAGSPRVTDLPSESPFVDVPTSHAFYEAIVWLEDTAITTGYDHGNGTVSFAPSQPVLREQMAAFLSRMDALSVDGVAWFAKGADRPVVSADGRWMAFVSSHAYTEDAVGAHHAQLYMADLATGDVQLVSEGLVGGPADGAVDRAISMSSDGRYVTWISGASNLVVGDRYQADAFLWDRETDAVTAVGTRHVPRDSSSTNVAISGDASTIVLTSLTRPGPNQFVYEVRAIDRHTDTATRLVGETPSQSGERGVAVSHDGSRVVVDISAVMHLWDPVEDSLREAPGSGAVHALSPDGELLARGDGIIDLASDQALDLAGWEEAPPASGWAGVAFAGDGRHVFVLAVDAHTHVSGSRMVRLDLDDQHAVHGAEAADGGGPHGISAVHDGSAVVFASSTTTLLPTHLGATDRPTIYAWEPAA